MPISKLGQRRIIQIYAVQMTLRWQKLIARVILARQNSYGLTLEIAVMIILRSKEYKTRKDP
jgi:hypothetical protein